MEEGTLLTDFIVDQGEEEEEMKQGENVLKDIFGNSINCAGGWNAQVNVTQFSGAMSTLHKGRGHGDQYKKSCNECVEEWKKNPNCNGCIHHPGLFLFKRRGNPTKCQLFTNAYQEAMKRLKNHEITGAYQILPHELRDIRQKLLSSNRLDDLQLYVGILLSIHLFLRHDEFARIKMQHVKPNLCQIKNGVVSRIAFQICGKTDKRFVTMFLHRCDDVPELCPVRHLLVYLYVAKNSKGFLFPRLKDRKESMDYNILLNYLKRKPNEMMDRPRGITTHVFRKTGYLFAAWGDADFDTARKSARHKNYATAQLYMQDAVGLLQSAENSDPNAKYQVPRFKMSIAINERSHQQIVDRESHHFVSLTHSAEEFMKMLGLHNHRLNKSTKFLIEKVCQFQPEKGCIEQVSQLLHKHLPVDTANNLQSLITQAIMEQARNLHANAENNDIPNSEPQNTCAVTSTKKRKRGGTEDLPDRHRVKQLKGIQKLELLLKIDQKRPEGTGDLTGGARNFVMESLTPVINCFHNHFQGDKTAFLNKWNLKHGIYQFGKRRCSGSDETISCRVIARN